MRIKLSYQINSMITGLGFTVPNKKMTTHSISRMWRQEKITGKLSDHNVEIINIKIISKHGKINYTFDELKH